MKKRYLIPVLIAIFGWTAISAQAEPIKPVEQGSVEEVRESAELEILVEQSAPPENYSRTAMLCPLDPSGTKLESYSHIVVEELPGLTWVDLTTDNATFFLSETQVDAKVRVANHGVNVNLNWYDLKGNFLGYQFLEKKQTGEWDVHFSFRFHPNLTFDKELQVVRMAACGQRDVVYLKQTADGWQIGLEN